MLSDPPPPLLQYFSSSPWWEDREQKLGGRRLRRQTKAGEEAPLKTDSEGPREMSLKNQSIFLAILNWFMGQVRGFFF